MTFRRWLQEYFEILSCKSALQAINIADARKRLNELKQDRREDGRKKTNGERFNYMKTIDPFVFEEMVISSFKDRKITAFRNEGYTRDGGVDGEIVLNGWHIFVQTKRFSGDIKPADVRNFRNVCNRFGVGGLFIHTGKTPPGAIEAAGQSVYILSGDPMLALLTGKPFRVWNVNIPADPAI